MKGVITCLCLAAGCVACSQERTGTSGSGLTGDPTRPDCGFTVAEPPPALTPDPCASETIVVGPERFERARGAPEEAVRSFTVPAVGGVCVRVLNARVSSAEIRLDGASLISPSRFNPHVTEITERAAVAAGNHVLGVSVRSSPGSALDVEVRFAPGETAAYGRRESRFLAVQNLRDDPDPFSPADMNGLRDTTTLSIEVDVRRLPGGPTMTYRLRTTFEIADPVACGDTRRLVTEIPLVPGTVPRREVPNLPWDGRDGAGSLVRDGGYFYRAVTELVRRGPHGRDEVLDRVLSEIQRVTVDNSPPTVRLLTPENGAVLAGSRTVQADAADNDRIARVAFAIDTVTVADDNVPPFVMVVDPGTLASGSHELAAIAADVAGNTSFARIVFDVPVLPEFGITSVSPAAASPGSVITIDGGGFSTDPRGNTVVVGGTRAEVSWASSTTLSTRVPEGASTGFVEVTSGGRTAVSPAALTILERRFTFPRTEPRPLCHGCAPETIWFKMVEGTKYRLRDGVVVTLGVDDLDEFGAVLAECGIVRLEANPLGEDRLAVLEREAENRSGRDTPDARLEFRAWVSDVAAVEEVIRRLRLVPWVEAVDYSRPLVDTMDVAPPTCDLTSWQDWRGPSNALAGGGYTGMRRGGINADFARGIPGGRGSAVRITLIESWWETDPLTLRWLHEDLPETPPTLLGHSAEFDAATREYLNEWFDGVRHGIRTAGVVAAQDNGYGMIGIAPEAEIALSTQIWGLCGGVNPCAFSDDPVPYWSAVNAARPGDIISISVALPTDGSDQDAPAEYALPIRNAIETAVGRGVVVVEAAGNSGRNLDEVIGFRPGDPRSGAIIVTGGHPTNHAWYLFNYGSAVALQGWGTEVATLGGCDLFSVPVPPPATAECPNAVETCEMEAVDPQQPYTRYFNGTSSATPMVAGAAAAIQGILNSHGMTPLDSWDMQQLLVETGTHGPAGTRAGPLPDLHAATGELLRSVRVVAAPRDADAVIVMADEQRSVGRSDVCADLRLVDVANPGAPTVLGSLGPEPCGVTGSAGYADVAISRSANRIFAAWGDIVNVVDTSDPARMVVLGSLAPRGTVDAVDYDTRYNVAYVTGRLPGNGRAYVESFDGSSFASLGWIAIPGSARSSAVKYVRIAVIPPAEALRVFVGWEAPPATAAVSILTVRDPGDIRLMGTAVLTDAADAAAALADVDLIRFEPVDPVPPDFPAFAIVAVGTVVPSAMPDSPRSRLWTVDFTTDQYNPQVVGRLDLGTSPADAAVPDGWVTGCAVKGQDVYVVTRGHSATVVSPGQGIGELIVVHAASRSDLLVTHRRQLPSSGLDIAIRERSGDTRFAYVASELGGLVIYDLVAPGAPVRRGQLTLAARR